MTDPVPSNTTKSKDKRSIEGTVFPDDPDSGCPEWKVGKHILGGYDDYLPGLLEEFNGKKVRLTIEVIEPDQKKCPECHGDLEPDSDYPDDLLCGNCHKVFDAKTLEFVEAF